MDFAGNLASHWYQDCGTPEKGRAQRISKTLSYQIKAGLQEDRLRRAAEARSVVDSLLTFDSPLIREAWIREAWISMRGWYNDALYRPPPPSRVAIATMMSERVDIYRHVPPPGQLIPVGLQPFLVDNYIPEDEEIAW